MWLTDGTDSRDNGEPEVSGLAETPAAFAHEAPLLGTLLARDALASEEEIARALVRQKTSGAPLGAELMANGAVRGNDLHRLIAQQNGIPFVNLEATPPTADLMPRAEFTFFLSHLILPWRRVEGEMHYVAADVQAASELLAEREHRPFCVFQSTPRDIVRAAITVYGGDLSDVACTELARTQPDASSAYLLSQDAKRVLAVLGITVGAFATLLPQTFLLSLILLAAAAFTSLALMRFASILFSPKSGPVLPRERHDKDLPVYSILVPLLREAEVLPILTHALQQLDYPASKLDIKLIFEEEDVVTFREACRLNLPDNFEFIVVPKGAPTTKPKACNFALPFVRGEYVVVFDAEDLPGPQQLREALHVFQERGPQLACVQAPLAYYNSHENWLTRQFAIEYAAIFDLLLPMLAHFSLPFPLGGTSTHFRTQVLRQAGAWDPYNVTEDADLGIRLHEAGYESDIIRTPTLEEANCKLDNWVRQRSRWLKGWMQTYIVRMRHPVQFYRKIGWRGFLVFQLVIGSFVLSALLHPILYLSFGAALYWAADTYWTANGIAFAAANGISLVLGFTAAILAGLVGAARRGLSGLVLSALTMPLYWVFISIGAYRGLYQLISRPHYWEKTVHGVSFLMPEHLARAVRDLKRTR